MLETEEKIMQYINHIKGKYKEVTHLDLSNRGLTELPVDMFKHLPKLKYLNLSMNHLTALPSLEGLVRLERLKLQHNQLTSLPSLHNNIRLKYLNIHGNQIAHLPFMEHLSSLERILLEGNPLLSLPPLLLKKRDIVVNIEEIEQEIKRLEIKEKNKHHKAFKYVMGEIECFPPEPKNYAYLPAFTKCTYLGCYGGKEFREGLEEFMDLKEIYG